VPRLNVLVATRPNHDLPTYYGHYWHGLVLREARRLGLTTRDLSGDVARRADFTGAIRLEDPLFFLGMGHGSPTKFTGQDLEVLMEACVNDDLMAGRAVYLLSCYTGLELGPSCVRKGCLSFLGYDHLFGFVVVEPYDPATDPYAKSFQLSSNSIPLTLIRGGTTGRARWRAIVEFDRQIDYWARSEDPYASLVIQWLAHDRDALVLHGREDVRVARPVVRVPAIGIPMLAGLILTGLGVKYKGT